MSIRTTMLKAWVSSTLKGMGITPEPGEVDNHARNLRLMAALRETETDPERLAQIEHDGGVYVSQIGKTAPHLDFDVPALPPPDIAVTRAQNELFAEPGVS